MISDILLISAIVLFILSFFINNKKDDVTDRIDQQAIETSKKLIQTEDRMHKLEQRVQTLENHEKTDISRSK